MKRGLVLVLKPREVITLVRPYECLLFPHCSHFMILVTWYYFLELVPEVQSLVLTNLDLASVLSFSLSSRSHYLVHYPRGRVTLNSVGKSCAENGWWTLFKLYFLDERPLIASLPALLRVSFPSAPLQFLQTFKAFFLDNNYTACFTHESVRYDRIDALTWLMADSRLLARDRIETQALLSRISLIDDAAKYDSVKVVAFLQPEEGAEDLTSLMAFAARHGSISVLSYLLSTGVTFHLQSVGMAALLAPKDDTCLQECLRRGFDPTPIVRPFYFRFGCRSYLLENFQYVPLNVKFVTFNFI